MTRELAFSLAMQPVGKQRARSTRSGHHYTPAETVAAERTVREAFREAYPGFEPHTGPVEFSVIAEFPVPASWPKWKRLAAALDLWKHTTKPDASNILKLVEDALNGCMYADDSAIFDGHCRKVYADTGRVVVRATLYDQPRRGDVTA